MRDPAGSSIQVGSPGTTACARAWATVAVRVALDLIKPEAGSGAVAAPALWRQSKPATQPTRGGMFRHSEPWLGELGDRLLVGANRLFEPVTERHADDAHTL